MVEIKEEAIEVVEEPEERIAQPSILTEDIERNLRNQFMVESLTAEPIIIETLEDPLERRGTQLVTRKQNLAVEEGDSNQGNEEFFSCVSQPGD